MSVTITAAPTSLSDLVAIAEGVQVSVADDAMELVRASRRVVDGILGSGQLVYGLNTGVGHSRDVRLPDEAVRAMQPVLIAMHAGGMGDPLPREVVRAAMAVRLIGLTRGGSGASTAMVDMLAAMLNAGIHPVAAAVASVGAGDLGQLAQMGLVALGLGSAEVDGQVIPGAEALRKAGLKPLELEPKDGLAFISANGVTLGEAALILHRTSFLLAAADVVAATSMDATNANGSVLDPEVQTAKGSPGQRQSAERMRAHLAGGTQQPASVQDPLSFRVAPQVHGACVDVLGWAESALSSELNALTDNPLASVPAGRLISNGNFHPMLVALSFEALRVALAHVGQLSERRLEHLWGQAIGGANASAPPDLTAPPPWIAGLQLRYAAGTRYTRLRQLADPVTLDVGPLDFGQEDHSTNAQAAVRCTREALDVLGDLITVELLNAYALLVRGSAQIGTGTSGLVDALGTVLASMPVGSPAQVVHEAVRSALPRLVRV